MEDMDGGWKQQRRSFWTGVVLALLGLCGRAELGVPLCWGANGQGQTSVPSTPSRSLACGQYSTCGIFEEGDVWCVGPNPPLLVPSNLTATSPAKQVVVGAHFACALLVDGSVHCFDRGPARRSEQTTKVPEGLRAVRQLSAGYGHACAVLDNDTFTCWGYNYDTPRDLQATHVAAGGFITCAVLYNGTIGCWGGYKLLQPTTVPRELEGRTLQVVPGLSHACAILDNSSLTCWGQDNYGQISVPADLGTVTQVALGEYHACAVQSERVRCWGFNSSGQSTPPEMEQMQGWPPLQISAGYYHTCLLLPTTTNTSTTSSTTSSTTTTNTTTSTAPTTDSMDDIDPAGANWALAGISMAVAIGGAATAATAASSAASSAAAASNGFSAAGSGSSAVVDGAPDPGSERGGEGREANAEPSESAKEQRLVEARSVLGFKRASGGRGHAVVVPAECQFCHVLRSLARLFLGELVTPPSYSGNLKIRIVHRERGLLARLIEVVTSALQRCGGGAPQQDRQLPSMRAYLLPTAAHILLGCGCSGREFPRNHQGAWEHADGGWAVRLSTKRLLVWDQGHLDRLSAKKTLGDKFLGILPQLMPLVSGLIAQSLSSEDIVPLLQLLVFTPLALVLSQAAKRCTRKACIRRVLGCLQWLRRLVDVVVLSLVLASIWDAGEVVLKLMAATAMAMMMLDLATLILKSLQAAYPACAKSSAVAVARAGFFLHISHRLLYISLFISIFVWPYLIYSSRAGFLVVLVVVSHVVENVVGNYKHDFEASGDFEIETADTKGAGGKLEQKDWHRLEGELRSSNAVLENGEFLRGYLRRRELGEFVDRRGLKREIAAMPILDMLHFLDNVEEYVTSNDVAGLSLSDAGLDFLGKSRAVNITPDILAVQLTLQEWNSKRNPDIALAPQVGDFDSTCTLLQRHISGPPTLRAGMSPELIQRMDRSLAVARQLHLEDAPVSLDNYRARIQVVVRCFDMETNEAYAMDSTTIRNIKEALSNILEDAVGRGKRRPQMLLQRFEPWVPTTPPDPNMGPPQEPRRPPPPAGPPQAHPAPAVAAAAAAAAPAAPAGAGPPPQAAVVPPVLPGPVAVPAAIIPVPVNLVAVTQPQQPVWGMPQPQQIAQNEWFPQPDPPPLILPSPPPIFLWRAEADLAPPSPGHGRGTG